VTQSQGWPDWGGVGGVTPPQSWKLFGFSQPKRKFFLRSVRKNFGKYVVGRQIFVERHLVDRLLSKNFRRHDTSSTQHFVDKHFVEIFSSTQHFVDTTLRRHDTSSTRHFVDTTLRRHDTPSTQHFVDKHFVEIFSSTRHFVNTTFRRHETSSKFFCRRKHTEVEELLRVLNFFKF
jgi:hypothetical protein